MLSVEAEHVDIANRQFKVLTKKGSDYRWVSKSIDEDVYPYWLEVVQASKLLVVVPGEKLYLFSEDLQPGFGEKPLRDEQISRRWQRHVKIKLGITADFYSLKHLRTTSDIDKMVDKAIAEAQKKAAKKNSHTTTAMVSKVYDVNTGRRAAIIKKMKAKKRVKRKTIVLRTLRDKTA